MEIPKYYELDTENFDLIFDNKKKIHIAVNKKTGEETNISVLGILLQMGVLKSAKESEIAKIDKILEKLKSIQARVGIKVDNFTVQEKPKPKMVKEAEEISTEPAKKEKPIEEEVEERLEKIIKEEPAKEKKPKEKDLLEEIEDESDRILSKEARPESPIKKSIGKGIKKEIMESVLEKTMNEEDKKENQSSPDVKKESEEEIDNWMEI
jgi:hypothetical protein